MVYSKTVQLGGALAGRKNTVWVENQLLEKTDVHLSLLETAFKTETKIVSKSSTRLVGVFFGLGPESGCLEI